MSYLVGNAENRFSRALSQYDTLKIANQHGLDECMHGYNVMLKGLEICIECK